MNPHLENYDSEILFCSHGWLNNKALECWAQNRCLMLYPGSSREPMVRPLIGFSLEAASFWWAKTPPLVLFSQIFDGCENFSEGWQYWDVSLFIPRKWLQNHFLYISLLHSSSSEVPGFWGRDEELLFTSSQHRFLPFFPQHIYGTTW